MNLRSKRISRRALLKATFAAGLGGSILGALWYVAQLPCFPPPRGIRLGVLLARAAACRRVENLFTFRGPLRPRSRAIHADRAGGVSTHGGSNVWLVRLEAGLALSAKCTHLGALRPVDPDFEPRRSRQPAQPGSAGSAVRARRHVNDEGVRLRTGAALSRPLRPEGRQWQHLHGLHEAAQGHRRQREVRDRPGRPRLGSAVRRQQLVRSALLPPPVGGDDVGEDLAALAQVFEQIGDVEFD